MATGPKDSSLLNRKNSVTEVLVKVGSWMDQHKLGEKIRDLRRRMKLTQTELAEPEFTKSFISQVEKGQTRPSLKSLQVIAAKLNQPVSYFLEESDALPRPSHELLSVLKTAGNLRASGLLTEAIGAYQQALTLCQATDHPTKAYLHMHLGRIHMELKQYRKAVDEFTLCVEEYKQTPVDESFVHALNNLGMSNYYLGRLGDARRYFDEALAEYARLGVLDVPLRLRVICNLVEVLSRLHLHEEASQVVEPAIRISADEGGYFLYGQLCHTAGIVFESLGKYAEALQYSERAINFFEAVGNPEMAIASQLVKGISLRKLGRLEESKAVSSAVIERTQSPEFIQVRAQAYAELAAVLSLEHDFEGCIANLNEALRLAPRHQKLPEWSSLVVQCSRHMALPPDFLQRLEELVDAWDGTARGKAELHSNLGELYRLAGIAAKATDHLSKSVSYFKQA